MHGVQHLGRLSALVDLALIRFPIATNDEGMQQLLPSCTPACSLYLGGFAKSEVHLQILSEIFAAGV